MPTSSGKPIVINYNCFTYKDFLRSYSWSSNILGCKIWFMIQPEQLDLLRNRHGNLPTDLLRATEDTYPHMKKCRPHFVYQMPGETLFVPSGWFHQVHNLGPTASINHNWLNAFNVVQCTRFLLHELEKTRESLMDLLEDRRIGMSQLDWERECQALLKAHAGMDVGMWLNMLSKQQHAFDPLYTAIQLDEPRTAQQYARAQCDEALALVHSDPHLRALYSLPKIC